MASWVFLGMAVLFIAAWAGLVLHVVILICAVAVIAAYFEPSHSETEEVSTLDR